MDDTIYRQMTMDALKEHFGPNENCIESMFTSDVYWHDGTVLDVIRSVPSAQPEQAIKDCRNCKYGRYNDYHETMFCYNSDDCTDWNLWEPAELPSAQPERKKGKWLYIEDDVFAGFHVCSECGERALVDGLGKECTTNFCPNCGVEMEGL